MLAHSHALEKSVILGRSYPWMDNKETVFTGLLLFIKLIACVYVYEIAHYMQLLATTFLGLSTTLY